MGLWNRLIPGKSDLTIRHLPAGQGPGKVTGSITAAQIRAIQQFLNDDVQPAGPITIRGTRQARGLWRFEIQGPLDTGAKQRIRNYLIDLLRS